MKKVEKLSPSVIETLSVGRHPDPVTAGLCVIVSATGRRTWQFRRRVAKSGLVVSLKLGVFPAHSVPTARTWAGKLNDAIERGEDPRDALRAKKAAALTVAEAHSLYLAAMRRGDRRVLKPRTIADKEVIFTRDIEPRLGRKILTSLSENECWDAVYDKANGSKDRANKMAGELSCFLRWCSGREGRMAGVALSAHPAPTLNSNWFATGPKANRRFLDRDELKLLLQALVAEDYFYRRAVLLLLLSAARRNELLAAPAAEIKDGVWTLPAERSKNGQPNIVAFGRWGRGLISTNSVWLFPSSRVDGPQIHGWFKIRDRLLARMRKSANRPIASWHFHDLRRTFRSHARTIGIDRDIAELMLNHTRKGMDRIYDANEELALRAAGFAVWDAFLGGLAEEAGCAEILGVPAPEVESEKTVEQDASALEAGQNSPRRRRSERRRRCE